MSSSVCRCSALSHLRNWMVYIVLSFTAAAPMPARALSRASKPSESSANRLRWFIALAPVDFLACRPIHQPHAACEQLLHHGLLDGAGLGAALFEGGDFDIDVAEDGGDGGLFFTQWKNNR